MGNPLRGIGCVVCFALLFVLSSCDMSPALEGTGPDLIDPVATQADSAVVTRGDVVALEVLQGVTRVHSDAVRLASGAGQIGFYYVWPGDVVKAGQLLARLGVENLIEQIKYHEENIYRMQQLHRFENDELLLDLNVRRRAYFDAHWVAAERLDTVAMENVTILGDSIEWTQLAQRQALERQALDLYEAESRLRELRGILEDAEIRACHDGVVTYLAAAIGDWVNARDPVLYLNRSQEVFVEYIGQGTNLARVRQSVWVRGQAGDISFELALIEPTVENQIYYGRRGLAPPIRFKTVNLDQVLHVGEAVSVFIYSQRHTDVLRVPRNAFFIAGPHGPFVYRIEDGALVHVPVVAGLPTESYVAVFAGLEEGDEVFVRP